MANVTDPLALAVHGTNPQNLIEYITRQRIYDSHYWKEQCFGLTAEDVTEKAALQIRAIGGAYGDNSKPTRFLCLILKMLQIQPDGGIIDELIQNEDFKYVRALGAFYLRLTGRPAEIYQKLEPLYHDYRKLKCRNRSDWSLVHVDEFVDQLLREDIVCGISLPRLPKRDVLTEAGYLDGPRASAVHGLLEQGDGAAEDANASVDDSARVREIHKLLLQWAKDGNDAAKEAVERKQIQDIGEKGNGKKLEKRNEDAYFNERRKRSRSGSNSWEDGSTQRGDFKNLSSHGEIEIMHDRHENDYSIMSHNDKHSIKREGHSCRGKDKSSKSKKKGKNKKYGSLFKSSTRNSKQINTIMEDGKDPDEPMGNTSEQHSEEYWNEQRAKLGLKPLRKS